MLLIYKFIKKYNMILSDSVILQEISKGNIIIEGLNLKYLNPVSVDLTLNPNFKVYG